MEEDRMLSDEILLGIINAKSGGGGGGTTNYNQLSNKPQIAGVTLSGDKSLADLGIASATAVSGILDGTDINSFGDVETALAGKQDALTAGDYINLNNGNISVNRNLVGNNYDYEIKSAGDYKLTIIKSQGGTVISTNTYDYSYGTSTNIDNNFTIAGGYSGGNTWVYTALKDSTTHSTGYTWTKSVEATFEENEAFPSEDLSGYKLVIKSELDAAISSAYHHAGTKTCAELVAGLLVAANEGNVYNMTDSGTTTADFIDGAGQPIKAGDNVGVAKISDGVYKFDLLSGFVDTTNFVQKSATAGLLKNDGTVNDEIEGDVATLKSGFTALDNEVNGDATTYPYADVIIINDVVPANLADCSVKVEPVQDLHGYDKPWVGGAGDNKFSGSDNTYTRSDQSATKWLFANVPLSSEFTGAYYISFDYLLSEVGDTGEVLFYGYSNGTQITGNICKMDDKTTSTQWKHFSGLMTKSVTFDAIGCYTDDLISIKNIMVSATDATFAPYTNICPISGHTETVVTVADDDTDPTVTNTYTLALGDTIYGGTVDFETGVMTVDRAMLTLNGTEQGWSTDTTSGGKRRFFNMQLPSLGYTSTARISAKSNLFENTTSTVYDLMDNVFILRYINSANRIDIMTEQFADVTEFATYLTSNNMQVLYLLATPFTVQLTPTQIQLLQGTNTLYASTGDISVTVNGVSGSIGAVQTAVNELAADIAEQLPDAPTTDGAYVLTVTVADGAATYSWESAE